MAELALKEKWLQGVALTTTILAVCAAIASLKATSYSTKVQLSTTQEANKWSHYQAKTIREHLYKMQADTFMLLGLSGPRDPKTQKFLDERLQKYQDEARRYDAEKKELMDEARGIQKQQDLYKRHNASFALSVMVLQIAIMMSSVGALMKKPAMWIAGLTFGAVGLLLMLNGFFLWFEI
jgi:hypothetical protein